MVRALKFDRCIFPKEAEAPSPAKIAAARRRVEKQKTRDGMLASV